MGKTLFDKLWDRHVVHGEEGAPQLLYIDLHLIHEVTSPQAFAGIREAGRTLRHPERTFATMDHNTPTVDIYNFTDLVAKNRLIHLDRTAKNLAFSFVITEVIAKGSSTWSVQKPD